MFGFPVSLCLAIFALRCEASIHDERDQVGLLSRTEVTLLQLGAVAKRVSIPATDGTDQDRFSFQPRLSLAAEKASRSHIRRWMSARFEVITLTQLTVLCVTAALLSVLLLAYFMLHNVLGAIVQSAIMDVDTELIGVDVVIGEVDVYLSRGMVVIRNCTILNPEGYKSPYLAQLHSVIVCFDLWNMIRNFGRDVLVRLVHIQGVDFIVEYQGFTSIKPHSNFSDVKRFLKDHDADKEESAEGKTPRGFIVDAIQVEDIHYRLSVKLGSVAGNMDGIIVKNFSTDKDARSKRKVVRSIMKLLMKSLSRKVTPTNPMDSSVDP
uniref:Uncharacterized protein n=1 Tax=Noctiluca scintillans TaxID=2966 RepID=A0A7S1AUQ8_NOCSC|mmetsp:Transcript_60983/g.161934  ORF Transcript_60983/g.161934 Transcript_60983/m.161934 type:complete len:322 (+) Transcript_60983:101-1066(+)